MMECPFTGVPLLACKALLPDVSVIHVERADELGNAQLPYKHVWHDAVIARAASTVIVTAEELVPSEVVRQAPEQTLLPGFAVDAVVHAPNGAWPTRFPGRYDADREALAGWLAASADQPTLDEELARWTERSRTGAAVS